MLVSLAPTFLHTNEELKWRSHQKMWRDRLKKYLHGSLTLMKLKLCRLATCIGVFFKKTLFAKHNKVKRDNGDQKYFDYMVKKPLFLWLRAVNDQFILTMASHHLLKRPQKQESFFCLVKGFFHRPLSRRFGRLITCDLLYCISSKNMLKEVRYVVTLCLTYTCI